MTTNGAKTHQFKSEAQQLLEIVIHSLYSHREVFLRELISNASDAIDKRRFEALSNPELEPPSGYEIRLQSDEDRRTLTVWDNGIGMSREETISNLGTIARSGTRRFVEALGEQSKKGSSPASMEELIGRFGVGFYATFMVADRVEVVTRRVGESEATSWVSEGTSTFDVSAGERSEPGTTVIVHLKPADEEEGLLDFTRRDVIRRVVKKYSDFVTYPIKLKTWRDETAEKSTEQEESDQQGLVTSDGKVLEWQTLNTMKAIWTRPEEDVEDEEYDEFYKHISHDWNPPQRVVRLKAEGTFEYDALLFIPKTAPLGLHHYDHPYGLQLYVNRVLIKSEAEELLPRYLRFVKGVVDSPDLSLNVSREMLQEDRRVYAIRKRIVKKVLDELGSMLERDREKYVEFWASFGPTLKEGVGEDPASIERVKPLLLFTSSYDSERLTTLSEYAQRMNDDQEAIYYITGEDVDLMKRAPQMEAFLEAGVEVLYLTDPIDELIVGPLGDFEGKPLRSVARGKSEIGSEERREEAEKELEEKKERYEDLLEKLRAVLQDQVKEVRLSTRLTSSPACLVTDEDQLSPRLVRMLQRSGQDLPAPKRILEVNATHSLMGRLQELHATDPKDPRIEKCAKLLFGQAQIAEGASLTDPAEFSEQLTGLMLDAL